jgi:hypothetical protein
MWSRSISTCGTLKEIGGIAFSQEKHTRTRPAVVKNFENDNIGSYEDNNSNPHKEISHDASAIVQLNNKKSRISLACGKARIKKGPCWGPFLKNSWKD